MFKFASPPAIKASLIATTLALSAFSLNAHATLTSTTSNGVDLVYSSVSDVTWTKDGNLLGTLFATQGYSTVFNAIIAASPTISIIPNYYAPSGTYTLSANDIRSDALTTWFGARAYVNYLNNINYGGSNQWYLPEVIVTGTASCDWPYGGLDCGYNVATNGTAKGDEFAELYYQELGGKGLVVAQPSFGLKDPQNKFINEQSNEYWSGTEYYAPFLSGAWTFGTGYGIQYSHFKGMHRYAWAVTPGQLGTPTTAVPEPEFGAMLLLGLGMVGFASRRRQSA